MHVCVFSSAYNLEEPYKAAAHELGTLIGAQGHTLIWGGGKVGTMGVVADAVKAAGGRVIGIIVEHVKHQGHAGADEMVVVASFRERKEQMLAHSDATVVLPGGIGTLDEVTEILELKKHKLHSKEIVFLNVDGFYDGLKLQLERMEAEGFLPEPLSNYLFFAKTPAEAMEYVESNYVG